MKVSALITLAHPLSRAGSDRWGQFVRPRGGKEHFWLGRALTPAEFNTEFPKALRFAGPDRPLVGRILVESDAAGEDVCCPQIPTSEHEAKIAEIQEGVNAWVAEQNQKLAVAAERIAALESQLSEQARQVSVPMPDAPPPTSEETIPAAPEGAAEGSDPVPAGAQVPDQPAAPAPAKAKKAKAK